MWVINTTNRDLILAERWDSQLQSLQKMSDILWSFFERNFFPHKDAVERIIGNVNSITSHCNEITYDEELNAETYALWHFLDRYHRFQILFDELFRQGIINFSYKPKKYPYDILDIWTWPWMSMYAWSEFFKQIISYWWVYWPLSLWKLDYRIDYLEQSNGFRNWLHHFTERYNYWKWRETNSWIPYHNWNFRDYCDFQWTFNDYRLDYWDEWELITIHFKRKFRFNMVISSNFFTDLDFFNKNIESFRRVIDNLRNNGILIVVWTASGKYQDINGSIQSFCKEYKDLSWRFDASLEELKLDSNEMSYNLKSPAWVIINRFRSKFFEVVDGHKLTPTLDKNMSHHMKNCKKVDKSVKINWNVMVFKKHSEYVWSNRISKKMKKARV